MTRELGLVNAVLGLVLGVFELGFAICIISSVYWHLSNVWVYADTPGVVVVVETQIECLLGSDWNSDSLCTYSYWAAGVSIFFTVVLMVGLCLTLERPAALGIALAGSSLLFIWWIIAAAIITDNVKDAMDSNSLQNNWRQTVVISMWVIVIMFFVQILVAAGLAMYAKWRAKTDHKDAQEGTHPAGGDAAAMVNTTTAPPKPYIA